MTQVYFHCSNANEILVDPKGAVVDDLVEARERATNVAQSVIAARGLADWRSWVLRVNDDQGEELFVLPFAFAMGKPH
jgi:hypothetical protein